MESSAAELLAATIETPRLTLRPMRQEDLDFVVRHFADPAVHRYMLDSEPITPADAAEIVDFYVAPHPPRYARWVLLRRADGEPLGTCGYHRWDHQHRHAELGYDLSPLAWGKGIMTEAVAGLLAHGFGPMALHRVEALVAPENTRSAALLLRLGFRREGLLRGSTFSGGRFHDHELFARLSSDAMPS